MKKAYGEILLISVSVVLFVVFNLILVSWTSFTEEMMIMKNWGDLVLNKGIFEVYRQGVSDYPPLYLLVLALNSLMVRDFSLNPLIVAKLVPILMILAGGFLVYGYLRKENNKLALGAFLLYIFNLSLIYNSSYWGQVDSVHSFLVLLTVIFLLKEKYLASSLTLLLAAMTKVMSLSFMPILWAIILIKCGLKRSIRLVWLNLLVVFLILCPFFLTGGGGNLLNNFFPLGLSSFVSLNAFNLWFFIFPGFYPERMVSDRLIWGLGSYREMGLMMLGVYLALVIYQLWKRHDKEMIWLAMASAALAFYILPTEIHERYLFSFLPILGLFCLKKKKYLLIYLVMSFNYLINMMMVMAFWGDFWPYIQIQKVINEVVERYSFAGVGRMVAIINVLTFIYFSKVGVFKNLGSNLKEDFYLVKKEWQKRK